MVTDMGDPGDGTEIPGPYFSNIWTRSLLVCPRVGLRIMPAGIAHKMQWHRKGKLEQGICPGLTSELMLSALGLTRMMVSRISLWWQRVLWPEGEM